MPGYEIVWMIGRGGFATVYVARQQSVEREVALKVISMASVGPDAERRFRAECRTIGGLSWHPHVVALYDAGFTPDGAPYLAMELVPGGSLGERMNRAGALSAADAIRAGAETADALSAAHEAGVLHRDVKPDNLLVGRRGEVKLSDFGIATLADTTRSATGSFAGTLAYSAPELLKGQRASPASDVFSLGATLHALLTGRPAFAAGDEDTPAAIMWRVVSESAPPLPDTVPAELAAIIERAMAKEPADRFESAAEMRAALLGLDAGPAQAPPTVIASTPHQAPTVRDVEPTVRRSPPTAEGPSFAEPATVNEPTPASPDSEEPVRPPASVDVGATVLRSASQPVAPTAPRDGGGVAGELEGTTPADPDEPDGPQPMARRRRWMVPASIAAVVLVVAAVLVTVTVTRSRAEEGAQQTIELPVQVEVGLGGGVLVVGPDDRDLWIVGISDKPDTTPDATLVRVDRASGEVRAEIDPGLSSGAKLAVAGGSIWVSGADDDGQGRAVVVKIDPSGQAERIGLPLDPVNSILLSAESRRARFLYAAGTTSDEEGNSAPAAIVRIDTSTGTVSAPLSLGVDAVSSMAYDSGNLWISGFEFGEDTPESGQLLQVDEGLTKVVDQVDLGSRLPTALGGTSDLWLASSEASSDGEPADGTVQRVSQHSPQIDLGDARATGRDLVYAVAQDDDGLWLSLLDLDVDGEDLVPADSAEVVLLDPATGDERRTIPLQGTSAVDLLPHSEGLWVLEAEAEAGAAAAPARLVLY